MDKRLEALFADTVIVSMFGKFYEKILEKYLEHFEGYEIKKDGKPIIYFSEEDIRRLNIEKLIAETDLKELRKTVEDISGRIQRSKKKLAKCMPDGLVKKGGKYIIWEAKCEARSIIKRMSWWPIEKRYFEFDWFLANKCRFKGENIPINGYILFWWSKPIIGQEIEKHEIIIKKLQKAAQIMNKSFEIKYIKEILSMLIKKKPDWYLSILKEQQEKINRFFNLLTST